MKSHGTSNRSLALKLLFMRGTLSRTEIAYNLGITTAAVTSIVNEFLSEGILKQEEEPVPEKQAGVGRRPAPLRINYDWKYVLAIDIHSYYINIALTDLSGAVLACKTNLSPAAEDPKAMCSAIAGECIRLLWEKSIPTEKVLGAGVMIIGPVNQDDGIALHAFRLFDEPFPIRTYFEAEFPFPVAVESNVCAFLSSEMLYTDITMNAQNILMLKWGPGVGSAMAIRGQIYKGYNYQSTEIGHNQIAEKGGKKCNCGLTGCLEPSISADAIVEFIQETTAKDPGGAMAELVSSIGTPCRDNLSLYLDHAPEIEPFCTFLEQCAHSLAAVTNNAIHILAPDKLILMGDLFAHSYISDLFVNQMFAINPQLPPDLCQKTHVAADPRFIGATAVAIEQILL